MTPGNSPYHHFWYHINFVTGRDNISKYMFGLTLPGWEYQTNAYLGRGGYDPSP